MSEVLEFGGRKFVAGLFWVPPGAEQDRAARRDWAWSVEWRDQIGWAPRDAGLRGVDGVPSLAASMAEYLRGVAGEGTGSGWVALLKADDGRFALVRVREGVIGAGGDEFFYDEAAAMSSVAEARGDGAEVYGTRGAVTDGGFVVEVDVAGLSEAGGDGGLKRGVGGTSRVRVALLSMALVALAAGGVAALAPDMLFGLFGGGKKSAVSVVSEAQADVFARIDSTALVEECGAAQVTWPPYLPAWEIRSIECHGWFDELELIALRPELEGRAVMLVRWELPGQYVAALHRRIAEEHLTGWYLGSVVERTAWAVVPLGAVVGHAEGGPFLSYLEFRREVDRHFGMQGASIDYGGEADEVAVTVVLGQGLGRIAGIVDGIPGFELMSLSRGSGREWVLKARPVTGFDLAESLFLELAMRARAGEAVAF